MKISLCVICKDEEKKIGRCLRSVKEVVDEMIIIDTGSTDNTIKIAEEEGAKIYQIPWEDSFSKARNYAIEQVDEGWIVFIDADEYFTSASVPHIRACVEEAVVHQRDYLLVEIINKDSIGVMGTLKSIKAFRKDDHIYYINDIHEALCRDNGQLKEWDVSDRIKLIHDGYDRMKPDAKDKEARNERLLLKELEKDPDNVNTKFYLLQNYLCQSKYDKVIEMGEEVLKYQAFDVWGAKELAYNYIIQACTKIMRPYDEVKKYYGQAICLNAQYPDFDYYFGIYHYKEKRYEECLVYFERCLEKIRNYKERTASYAVGNIERIWLYQINSCFELNKINEAISTMIKVLRINPDNVEVLLNLVQILQGSEETSVLGEMLSRLYNLDEIRHQLLLLKVSQQCNNKELFNFFYNRADNVVKNKFNNSIK